MSTLLEPVNIGALELKKPRRDGTADAHARSE